MQLTPFATELIQDRYTTQSESWEDTCIRIGRSVAVGESNSQAADVYAEMINDLWFLPGGRIIRNSGRIRGSMLNCYVLPIGDSIEGIGNYIRDSLVIWAEGGGVGCNFSTLRPKGALIRGRGNQSSGLLSFLIASDATAQTIKSGGERRAAGLACVDISHPEILPFINAKIRDGAIHNYNLSVGITNDFIAAVESGADWEFRFNNQSYGTAKAKGLWKSIIKPMVEVAEPGMLNFTNLTKNNSYYFDPIVSTNPCGEVPLEEYGVCCLGSLVLPRYVSTGGRTSWSKMEEIIDLAIRFLDNVLDVNKYVLSENKKKAKASRRLGLGVMGLAEYLCAKGIRYGSPEALEEVERLFKFIRNTAYTSSVRLAEERGTFPKFETVPYVKAKFIRSLPVSIRKDIKQYGIRNVTLMAIAPTGTISQIAGVSSGIEPIFAKAYERNDGLGKRIVVHPLYFEHKDKGEMPDWFVDAYDLRPEDHLEMQALIQRYVDGAVSKTINLPENFKSTELDTLLLEYIKDLKGVTVYRDGAKGNQPLKRIPTKDIQKWVDAGKVDLADCILVQGCPDGNCEL